MGVAQFDVREIVGGSDVGVLFHRSYGQLDSSADFSGIKEWPIR